MFRSPLVNFFFPKMDPYPSDDSEDGPIVSGPPLDMRMAHLVFTPLGYQLYTEMILREVDDTITFGLVSPRSSEPGHFRELLLQVLFLVRTAHGVAYRQRRVHIPGTEFLAEPRRRIFMAAGPTVRSCCYVRNKAPLSLLI